MIEKEHYGAHSAQVEMRLLLNGSSITITHMGRDFLLLESPIDHAPGEAQIFLKVDESESQWKVSLPEGISKESNRVALAAAR